jgi:hypothetical protein
MNVDAPAHWLIAGDRHAENTHAEVEMSDHTGFGWMLLALGLVLAGIGLVWILARSIPWLGRLPGDIRIEGERFRFYFPLVTCLLLSVVLTAILWITRLFRD